MSSTPPTTGGHTAARHRVYDATKMYGAKAAFASNSGRFLGRAGPIVLAAAITPISIDFGNISGPLILGAPAQVRSFGSFNPSLVAAPAGLCPRCAYVASLRVEALHQCDRSSPLFRQIKTARRAVPANAFFRMTAIAVLDEGLRVLGYTWLITSHNQVGDKRAGRRWTVATGAADAFPPSWGHAVYDVRLINVDGRIFATYVCHGCIFGLLLLHITAEATADGGLRSLRAWRSQRFVSNVEWARGRNQAVFSARRTPTSPTEIFVQPWLSIVASFGVPRFYPLNVSCYKHPVRRWQLKNHYVHRSIYTCMHNARSSLLQIEQVDSEADTELVGTKTERDQKKTAPSDGAPSFGSKLELLANLTSDLRSMLTQAAPHRISTTAHLVHLHDAEGKGLLLGVAHIRREVGDCMTKLCKPFKNRREWTMAGSPAFRWGHHYTHFFYSLTPHAPFRIVGTSREFCIGSAQDPDDCESVQFITGLALRGESTLLMAYGINDCEAKVAELPVKQVLGMLLPLTAE